MSEAFTGQPVEAPVRPGVELQEVAPPRGAGNRAVRTRVAILVWSIGFVLSAAAVWPAWRWWMADLAFTPAGDGMGARFEFGIFKELVAGDRGDPLAMTGAALSAAIFVALILNPLLAGGALGAMADGRTAGAVPRFFETGARFYWRCLRALVYVGVPALVVLAVVWEAGASVASAAGDRGAERLALALYAANLAASLAAAAFFTAVLDLVRIDLVLTGSRLVLAAVPRALRRALRSIAVLLRIGAVFILAFAALALVTLVLRAWLPGSGWSALAAALFLQQAFVYGRTRLRVGVLAAEIDLVRAASETDAAQGLSWDESSGPGRRESALSRAAQRPAAG